MGSSIWSSSPVGFSPPASASASSSTSRSTSSSSSATWSDSSTTPESWLSNSSSLRIWYSNGRFTGRAAAVIFASDLGCDFLVRENLAVFVTRHSFWKPDVPGCWIGGILRKHVWCRNNGAAPAARRKRWLAPSLQPPKTGKGRIKTKRDVELRQQAPAINVDLRNHGRKAGRNNTRGNTQLCGREGRSPPRRIATSLQYITFPGKEENWRPFFKKPREIEGNNSLG